MSGQCYVGASKRSFKQVVIHLLETEYGLVGSGRILQMLAEDIEQMVNQFYPEPKHISSGWMVFTGTKAQGGKAYPGQPVSDHQLVTLVWPVCPPEDVQAMATMPPGDEGKAARRRLLQQRIVRLVEYGWDHTLGPVLLTLADLSLMLGISAVMASQLLAQARQETGKPLPTMGYYFDQGMCPSHKGEIVSLYEQGLDEAEIAYRSQHAQSSVGRYLRDYERVKLSLQRDVPLPQIPQLTGLRPAVVKAYAQLTYQYHPHLRPMSDVAL